MSNGIKQTKPVWTIALIQKLLKTQEAWTSLLLSLVLTYLMYKINGVHSMNSKVFSSCCDLMVVILMTIIIMSTFFI